jgi:hypothetical protein
MRKLIVSESYQNCHKVVVSKHPLERGKGSVWESQHESVDLLWEYSGTLYTPIVSTTLLKRKVQIRHNLFFSLVLYG